MKTIIAALDFSDANEPVIEQPLHTILEYADGVNADMLVLGSYGHGFLGSLLLGSVAEGDLRKAKIPSLIVPVEKKSK